MKLIALRHGPTDWNDAGRIQGHSDIALSERAHAIFAVRSMPEDTLQRSWFTSPLERAMGTAHRLGVAAPTPEPRLREMHWGEWEGLTRADIAARYGDEMVAKLTARGLDFRPPGGESPREMCARVSEWLAERAAAGVDLGLVAHKGVLRSLVAIATGWDMQGKSPVRIDWSRAQQFQLTAGESFTLGVETMNIPLPRSDGGDPNETIPEW